MPQRLSMLARMLVLLPAVLLIAAGCSRKVEANRLVRLAVLDGITTYDVAPKGEVQEDGWWFSSRDRYLSGNVGVQLGEALADRFQRLPGVEVFSRDDLSIYMAQKERLINRNYPDLNERQRRELLLRQSPVDYGQSLNVDYVLTSEVLEAKTVVNRVIAWWYSRLSVAVELWDVSTGEVVFRHVWTDGDNFDSQLALVEEAAKEIAKRAKRRDAFNLYK